MRILPTVAAFILSGVLWASPQADNPTPQADKVAAADRDNAGESDTVYGRIKEVEDKQKIVIEVDNGRDRTYSLADPRKAVRVAEDLAIGDRVKVYESEEKGARTIEIVRDTRPQGDQERSRKSDQSR